MPHKKNTETETQQPQSTNKRKKDENENSDDSNEQDDKKLKQYDEEEQQEEEEELSEEDIRLMQQAMWNLKHQFITNFKLSTTPEEFDWENFLQTVPPSSKLLTDYWYFVRDKARFAIFNKTPDEAAMILAIAQYAGTEVSPLFYEFIEDNHPNLFHRVKKAVDTRAFRNPQVINIQIPDNQGSNVVVSTLKL